MWRRPRLSLALVLAGCGDSGGTAVGASTTISTSTTTTTDAGTTALGTAQ